MTATDKIIPFAFEDNLVRVYKPNGEPWFVGRDVCRVLDIKNESHALARLDADERLGGVVTSDPMGREQTVICISEPGVFRLIFTSRKPEAERFKRFLAHEVLPALRKHGTYTVAGKEAVASNRYQFPADGEALSMFMAKVATLRECRLIHGERAAARLWVRLDMPPVTDGVYDGLDEGRRCLHHVLSTASNLDAPEKSMESECTLYDEFEEAVEGDATAQQFMAEKWSLLVMTGERDGLFIPNRSGRVFRDTQWADGRHMPVLRRLPGVLPMRQSILGERVRGTFVPAALIESMPRPDARHGENVVPLRH